MAATETFSEKLLYEGKAKQIFKTASQGEILIRYKDSATAFNGEKKEIIAGKGRLNMAFTKHFFTLLENNGIKTHTVKYTDELSMIAKKVEIILLETIVRNYAAGSICKRLGYEKGVKFEEPVFEIFYKNDDLGDPLITQEEAVSKGLASAAEINIIKNQALAINEILSKYADSKSVTLVDFKLEFGRLPDGEIILADEISPDTCRFWKKGTTDSLDKDVFREAKGSLIESYTKLAGILGVEL
ncbi:MAG: phosphoribosylaminoimidazolesuccinocarboxamide synthase [Heliobacteriaceae bacterium]|jgi:phosphoribosylaminoimidazole-succinocarboxamide synthase|nr:phosphoribosylaminoimidazolesuccinocarboxamide synthase [Heliobacteriaceae bacterium]